MEENDNDLQWLTRNFSIPQNPGCKLPHNRDGYRMIDVFVLWLKNAAITSSGAQLRAFALMRPPSATTKMIAEMAGTKETAVSVISLLVV